MKKLLVLMLALVMLASIFVGCTQKSEENEATEAPVDEATEAPSDETTEAPEPEVEGYEIAMITDSGEIDDKSFNQGTYEGIQKYADENGKTYKYYKPTEISDAAYLAAIDLAIQGGAKIVVTPGYFFTAAIGEAQDLYPDVKFMLIDANPEEVKDNLYCIYFAEQEAGFLAGYAAVKEGYTKLGFMGGVAVPAVIRYGYGFIQGAEYAAKEMGVETVEVNYHYTGDFAATPKNQTTAATWYANGTEVIFACGGKVGSSVMAAADAAEAKVVGVDVDQSGDSETVITSAFKLVGTAAYLGLEDFYADEYKGGTIETLDITVGAVGLPFASSRFETFTEDEYQVIYDALVADTDGIRSSIVTDSAAATDVPAEIVSVTIVE